MKPVMIALVAAVMAIAQTDQKTSNENQVRDRGQVPPEGRRQMPKEQKGRAAQKVRDFHGLLLDAGCQDRTTANLRQTPLQPDLATQTSRKSGAGVSVDSNTANRERADALEHQVPDLKTRQMDPTCAISGSTRAFLVLLDDGKALKLDEGGNTFAMEAIQTSPAGRAMLNGSGPAFKPAITLRGHLEGDAIVVQKILKLQ
jgi:hypothetical protein